MRHPIFGAAVALAIGVIGLAACNQQASKPARTENASNATSSATDASATVTDSSRRGDRAGRKGERGDRASRDGPMRADGTPMWAGNRKRPARENAQRMFDKNGKDFGASSVDDYVNKAHAFVASPPSGVKTATRANGDKLYYDPSSNTFAVVNRRGAPRIMMKPRNGAAYWTEQLATLDDKKGGGRRNRQARRGGRDGGDSNGGDGDDAG